MKASTTSPPSHSSKLQQNQQEENRREENFSGELRKLVVHFGETKAHATREPEEVSQLPAIWHFAFAKSPCPCFSPYIVEFQALVSSSIEVHLMCHVTLLHCQVDPNPKPKANPKLKNHCCHS